MGDHYSHLSAEERGAIMVGLAHGHSRRQLARALGRSPSTIVRELARNGHRSRIGWLARQGRPPRAYDATISAGVRASFIARPCCGAMCVIFWPRGGRPSK